jgi:glycosyltransferase involved in cell wall biosynthesis
MFGPTKRICVITPYYKEPRPMMERCLESVRAQTFGADHMLVADGFPQGWLDEAGVRHLKLDRAHGDFGNAARGAASLLAIAEQYDAIAFLDADNWYEPGHLERCLEAARALPTAPYVVALRDYVRPDGSVMPLRSTEDLPNGDHVDTNCYLLLPPTYPLLHHWCATPREFAAVGDRLFRLLLKARLGPPAIASGAPTVKYLCLFEPLYRAIGEPPPPNAKPGVDWRPAIEWLKRLSPEDRLAVDRLAGLSLSQLVREAA